MITVRLRGGLGNQLFQYAAARALALRLGTSVALDIRNYRRKGVRAYELASYDLPVAFADWAHRPPRRGNRIRFALWRALHPRLNLFYEKQHAFDPAVLSLPDETHLQGYFQSELYFAEIADTIRRDLTLSRLSPEGEAVLRRIAATTSVSVHVRRGDYLSDARNAEFFGAPEPAYYRDAAGLVAERLPANPTFFVFSDDLEWTRANLALPFPAQFVDLPAASPPAESIALMAACRHHVMANSTFSWWGAWLNPSPDKIVVAPRRWFKTDELDASTVVPATWLRL